MKKKTHEEYVEELKIKNPTVEVVGEYVNAKTKILFHCLIHDAYWEATPFNMLRGSGCELCRREKIHNSRNKSHEQYVSEINNANPNVIVLEQYIDAKTPILHKCLIHNFEWKVSPDGILHGYGCPKCKSDAISNKLGKSHEQYVSELKEANPNIIVIGDYINANTPILHKCLIDDYEWNATPANILNGYGCPKCSQRFRRKHDDYVNDVALINPDIEVVGEYINARTQIAHKCKIDGCVWEAMPNNILHGSGCPQCQESSGERQVRQWLNNHNIDYVYQKTFYDCKDKQPLPFDFYLPAYNMCIEYQGGQHYFSVEHFGGEEKFSLQQKHDKIKSDYCKEQNIELMVIPYDKDVNEELNNFLFI